MSSRSLLKLSLALFVSTGALTFSAPYVLAQENKQTRENAHKFLMQLSSERRITYKTAEFRNKFKSYSTQGNNGQYRIVSDTFYSSPTPELLTVTGSAICKTNVVPRPFGMMKEYEQKEPYIEKRAGRVPGDETWRPWITHVQSLAANGIDWSRVASIKLDGENGVRLDGTSFSGGYIVLLFESKDMATRAEYALNVIRMSCDPVSDTGF